MKRRRQTIGDHLGRIQIHESRMQLFKIIQIIEDRLDNGIDGIGIEFRRCHHRSLNAKSGHWIRITLIEPTGNPDGCIEWILGHEFIDGGTLNFHQESIAQPHRLFH